MGITAVTEATDGRDALVQVTNPGVHFDLILCDLGMPGRDGVETIRTLAALGLDSAIAILSMEEERLIEMAATLVESQGLRLVGAITKPLTAEKMDRVLARMRSEREPGTMDPVVAPEYDLAGAFVRRELRLMYQPKVEIKSRRFVGVEGCSSSPVKRSVVEASLALARSLKLVSVAEGVQNVADWDLLDQLGCDVVQGYYIARPMTEEGLETWAAHWTARQG